MPADIRRLARNAASDRISKPEVDQIIASAQDGKGVTANEKTALKGILARYDSKFEPEAKTRLQEFLGLTDSGSGGTGQAVSKEASKLTALEQVGDKFLTEFEARKAEFTDEQKLYNLFQDYSGALTRLKEGVNPIRLKFEQEKLLANYEGLSGSAYGKTDADSDGLTRASELLQGTDAAKADTDGDKVHDGKELKVGSNPTDSKNYGWQADRKAWNDTNYWPMAGSGGLQTGDGTKNMWADNSPLDKLDKLKEKRTGTKGTALEHERKSALNWLMQKQSGSFIPYSSVQESNAERTTGVDFDGDGKITDGVKADFLDRFNNLVSATTWDPYLGDTKLKKNIKTGADGQKTVEYTKQDGAKLTDAEKKDVYLAPVRNNVRASDNSAAGTNNVGWWGRCDGMAHVGTVFDEPKHDVTVDGITFTKNDIKGMLGIMAESLAGPTSFNDAWVGNRFDDQPEVLGLKDGTELSGRLKTPGVEFNTSKTTRSGGDYMVISALTDTPKEKLDAQLDGKPLTKQTDWGLGNMKEYFVKEDGSKLTAAEEKKLKYGITFEDLQGKTRFVGMDEIKYLAKEDKADVNPALFHDTLQRWVGEQATGGVMDSYAGGQVWNYNYWKADVNEVHTGFKPDKPGVSGMPKPDNKVVKYDTALYFGKQDAPKGYSYWIEYDKTSGKPVNSGWVSENPDFLWRHPKDAPVSWNGALERNPYVDLKLLQEIYTKSISP